MLRSLILLCAGLALARPMPAVQAAPAAVQPQRAEAAVSPYDLIVAMNSLRLSNGLPALVEDPIIDAVAQSTAQTMAANQMSWHIGNVSGRLAAAGYGGGSTVWGTENFAVGSHLSIDEIMVMWSDESHMIPAVKAAYCNIGAGTAVAPNGMTYFILQAAYTSGKACGEYTSSGPTLNKTGDAVGDAISQLIQPVKIATPDADGKVYHVVGAGQSFWSIAIAYKITIKDLQTWNNLASNSSLRIGQKLFIPGSNTAGYATPTQPGSIQVNPAEPDGKISHVVQPYQTLSTIAQAYGTTVETILALNGLDPNSTLQIGQKLTIHPSNNTPSPTLSPLQKLTPADDGKYYHTIQNGETLSLVALFYRVTLSDLMAWNGLTADSILLPGQKLVLQVTPPATATATAEPPTATATAVDTPVPPTPSSTPLLPGATPTLKPAASAGKTYPLWVGVILLAGSVVGLGIFFYLRKKQPKEKEG